MRTRILKRPITSAAGSRKGGCNHQRFKKKIELEQQLIVTYSIKYRNYLRSIRNRQVERTMKAIDGGAKEEMYDGFYAVFTSLEDKPEAIVKVNQRRWEIEEGFRIMKNEFQARPGRRMCALKCGTTTRFLPPLELCSPPRYYMPLLLWQWHYSQRSVYMPFQLLT